MNKAIFIILALTMVAAGIFWVVKVREPSQNETQADFCGLLKNFGEAVMNLRSIDQNSTVEELRDAQKAVQVSWEDLQQSAFILKDANLDALEASYSDLETKIQNIPNDSNLAQAQTEIYRAALNILANTLAADQVTCKFTAVDPPDSAGLLP